MPSAFKHIYAYRLADSLAFDVSLSVRSWTPDLKREFGWQLARSAHAVPANIAEACGKHTLADRRRILYIARGELQETEHWLGLAERLDLIPAGTAERAAEAARILNRFIAKPGRFGP